MTQLIVFSFLLLCCYYSPQAQTVTTVAGMGYCGAYSGDGGPATAAEIDGIEDIFYHTNGDIYIATMNRIRKVDGATGIITTVAGNGTYSYSGDGGAATAASLGVPASLYVDKNNNIYIGDGIYNTIRKVDAATGIITTIAGTGLLGYSGDGGPATNAMLAMPSGISVDINSNIYIADQDNNRIRKIDATTGIITTIAGNGAHASTGDGGLAANASIGHPSDICFDSRGNIFIAEYDFGRIRRVDAATGIITTIAGTGMWNHSGDGGLAINAELGGPYSLVIDALDNIYMSQTVEGRIRKIDASTGIITTIINPGVLALPKGLAMDTDGQVYAGGGLFCVIARACANSVIPEVQIRASATAICPSTAVTFTATSINGGRNPVYQWKVNGLNVGTNSTTYISATRNNGDVVTCELVSNAACATVTTATSDALTITVNPIVTPALSITASSNNICTGQTVTFTATPTNGGTGPMYQWKVNGLNVGTNSAIYTSNTLINSDIVTCEMTSNANCLTTTTANSNPITMAVTIGVSANVSINASATAICAGSPVTFTATPTNGGTAPIYQWKVNGTTVGTNSVTYTSNTLNNSDVITCELASNAPCLTTTTAISNSITMAVTSTVTPGVSITASASSICVGTPVTFTATTVSEGTTPVYQWKVNGGNVGINNPTYTSTTLANGDVVSCELTSNATCATVTTATSNAITMTVNANVTPSLSIAASAFNTCSGSGVTFTAMPLNGGTMPAYQWKVNGANVGTNSPIYTSTTLANGDIVNCELTSNATCLTTATANSNAVTMIVTPTVTPGVSIAASAISICAGGTATFTATPTNGGAAPTYQWQVNGTIVGTNSPIYTSNSLTNGDVVTCTLTSNAACLTTTMATSNAITMMVTPMFTPTLNISASTNPSCAGEEVTFLFHSYNYGTAPTYQWQVNGVNVSTNSIFNIYRSTTLNNGDIVTCILTANAACVTTPTVTSNAITVMVRHEPAPVVNINADATIVCTGTPVTFTATNQSGNTNPAYQWQVNGTNAGTNSPTFKADNLNDKDEVVCIMTVPQCPTGSTKSSSNPILMTVRPLPVITINSASIQTEPEQQVVLPAQVAGNIGSYYWTPAGSLVNPTSLTPQTVPLTNSVNYRLTVRSIEGCEAFKEVTVRVLRAFYIPNSFSPNGDGKNEAFRIPPATALNDPELVVFDRWGNKVFSTKDPDKGWNGKYKGKPAPVGSYVYIVTGTLPNGEKILHKGTVTLIR